MDEAVDGNVVDGGSRVELVVEQGAAARELKW